MNNNKTTQTADLTSTAPSTSTHAACGCCHDHGKEDKTLIPRLIIGAIIFAATLIAEHFFAPSHTVLLALYITAFVLLGGDILLKAAKNIAKGRVFDENFLMALAAIGAFLIGEYAEAAGVMLFYQVGELFQSLAVKRAKKSISSLLDIRPDYASLVAEGDENATRKVSPDTVQIGDIIIVRPSEKIPLDGVVVDGTALLDTAAITGESVPRKAATGDAVLSGCINQNGVIKVKVTKTFYDSTASKIIDLVTHAAEKKAPTEAFITKFARVYTPIVVLLAVLIAAVPPLIINAANATLWSDYIRRGLMFLVISCPCALVISIPLGFFGGLGGASKSGILIKGGNYLEALNNLEIAVFDKTGTLTKGKFKVAELLPSGTTTPQKLLETAAKAEAFSVHPIATSIIEECGKDIDKAALSEYTELAGRGISVKCDEKTILAGNARLMQEQAVASFTETEKSGTKVYISEDGEFLGCIIIKDEIKPDSRKMIAELTALNIRTVMLTGDNQKTAHEVAAEVGITEVHASLLPQDKLEIAQQLLAQKSHKGKLAFMGDGINDTPVLAAADIGISMGGIGSDAAVSQADIVIMTDEPSKLVDAIKIAKRTRKIVWQNIIFALGIKVAFLALGAFGIATMWEAVFADVGVALLAVLNSLRAVRAKH